MDINVLLYIYVICGCKWIRWLISIHIFCWAIFSWGYGMVWRYDNNDDWKVQSDNGYRPIAILLESYAVANDIFYCILLGSNKIGIYKWLAIIWWYIQFLLELVANDWYNLILSDYVISSHIISNIFHHINHACNLLIILFFFWTCSSIYMLSPSFECFHI